MGKAGAGKDTLLRECLALYPGQYHEIVSCTTRPPREGEVDGVNYHFLTSEEFAERLEDGRMIEATIFRDGEVIKNNVISMLKNFFIQILFAFFQV